MPSIHMISIRLSIGTYYATNITLKARWNNVLGFNVHPQIVFLIRTVATLNTNPGTILILLKKLVYLIFKLRKIMKTKDLFWILMFPHHVIIIWFSVWTNKFTNTALKARWNKVLAFYVHPHICFVFWAVTTLDTTPWTTFSLGKILLDLKIKLCNMIVYLILMESIDMISQTFSILANFVAVVTRELLGFKMFCFNMFHCICFYFCLIATLNAIPWSTFKLLKILTNLKI